MFEIEKDVPIPEDISTRAKTGSKYPFGKMEVGDSVLIEGDFLKTERARCASLNHARRNKKRFVNQRREGGIRIWRKE